MAKPLNLKSLLFALVKQVKLDMEKQFAKNKIKVTPFQYGVLVLLKNDSHTLNELAEKLGVRPPSLVPPIESLVRTGYVHRKPDRKDRRKIHLVFTTAAAKIFAQIHRDHPTDTLNIAFKKLPKSKQKQLMSLLSELSHHLQ